MTTILILSVVIALLAVFFFLTYTVVEPNKAHVVVFMGRGRKVFSPHTDEGAKKGSTSYFHIPFLMERTILPLTNVKMEIPSFELKDQQVAPFMCEVTCWFRILRPEVAVEKLDVSEGFELAVRDTLEEQVRGIARAAAMKQEILEIMRDRKTFGDGVEQEVNGALVEWGLELVKLEIVDFSDVTGSQVIRDYENMRKATIQANSRKVIAEQDKEATLVEAETKREAGVAMHVSEREVEKANVEKERQVLVAKEDANATVAKQRELANLKKVEAQRALEVGQANVTKQATIEEAEGEAEAEYKRGKARADVKQAEGNAEAEVIRSKGLSEAEATDKKAEALKKYNEAGITLEQIKAYVEIEVAKYENLGQALANADINLVGGTEGNSLFGFNLDSQGGANLGQFITAMENTSGKSTEEIIDGIKNATKKK